MHISADKVTSLKVTSVKSLFGEIQQLVYFRVSNCNIIACHVA